ncbi:hypothetical protein [Massilia pseudoviolaceinigra]|uniref:hypothetical protein n=1 Tax=Massilia pseudoviolaceinigra TaxID=3057165 RepID=UPI002796CD56|nr:hypothetical protein [Massilia sp. CCM 9206]MDQ1924048.1 hypothetical protein [Massilia sp. CCM 9206]
MKVLDKEMLSQLVGGVEVDGGGAGDGSGGSGEVPGGGVPNGGGFGADHGYAYDVRAIGIEGGQEAVVTIRGAIPVFDNPPPNVSVGQEPAAWEGSLVGMYVENQISIEHETMDRVLSGMAGIRATTAGTAFLQGALKGAGIGEKGGKWGELGGLVIGGFVGYGSYMLMQRDHPNKDNQTWRDKDGVPHYPRGIAPEDDEHVASYSGPAGGNVMQMIA